MAGRIKSCYGKKSRIVTKSTILVGMSRWTNTQPSSPCNQVKNDTIQGSRQLFESLHEQRRRIGQCYKCGEKYSLGHLSS
jgi:hypothetical protein